MKLALQRDGSDAHSDIAADPALGLASAILIAKGGTANLSDAPEAYGAEHLLAVRATQPDVAERRSGLNDWWRDLTQKTGGSNANTPSDGNTMGCLSTIAEKSLGATSKSGRGPLAVVYEYGAPVSKRGPVSWTRRGTDPICSTDRVASGVTVKCFITARGSVSGMKPVHNLKLATSTVFYNRLRGDLGINCCAFGDAEKLQSAEERIYRTIIDTAPFTEVELEINGFGDREFALKQLGAIL